MGSGSHRHSRESRQTNPEQYITSGINKINATGILSAKQQKSLTYTTDDGTECTRRAVIISLKPSLHLESDAEPVAGEKRNQLKETVFSAVEDLAKEQLGKLVPGGCTEIAWMPRNNDYGLTQKLIIFVDHPEGGHRGAEVNKRFRAFANELQHHLDVELQKNSYLLSEFTHQNYPQIEHRIDAEGPITELKGDTRKPRHSDTISGFGKEGRG